jgi:hypothetical protein
LRLAAFEGAPEELDVTIFENGGAAAAAIADGARRLVAAAHSARQFTDTGMKERSWLSLFVPLGEVAWPSRTTGCPPFGSRV